MILSIAWKNIWRSKVRSIIIITAIAIGMTGGMFSSAFMNGMVHQRLEAAISNESAHVQIHNPRFQLNKELDDTIASLQELVKDLDTCKAINAYSVRLKISAMAASANNSGYTMINGIDPSIEKKVTGISKCIADSMGNWFTDNRKNQIVVGEQLAKKLKIKLRSKIVMTFQDTAQNMVSAAFKVCGIYRTENTSFDERNVFVNKSDLSQIIGYSIAPAHEIAIRLHTDESHKALISSLSLNYKHLSIESWRQLMPDLGLTEGMTRQMLIIVMTIILFALSFGIINTMMMAVLERTRELGMLMAIGMNKAKVFRMIMLESVLLTLTGGVIGVATSIVLIEYFNNNGLYLSAFSEGLRAIGYDPVVYPFLDVSFYIDLTLLILITGILSSIIPARRALKLKPVEAIRNI